jgi:hypothetical protein
MPKKLASAALAILSLAFAAPAHADIWSPIASGTTSDITGIEYQSDSRFWFVTGNGEIFTRQPDGSFSRRYGPSSIALTAIAFQPGGQIGVAVGQGGQVLRSIDGGATWTSVNTGGSPIPVSKKSTTFATCDGSEPLGDVNSVRFAGAGRVWIFAEGAQMATSQPVDAANVGAVGTWTDANRDTKGTPGTTDDTCKLLTGYGEGIDDAFFTPNPDVGYICTAFFGETFLTTNNLASAGTKKAGDCGNGAIATRRMAGDPDNPSRMWAVGPGDANLSYMRYTTDAFGSSSNFQLANPDAHALGKPYDVAFAGGTAVAVGDGGMILTSINGTTFFHNPAGGANATAGWHAVGAASATQAAVGGAGGALVITTQANVQPDIVAPTGTISGPATAVPGQAVTFTANVSDNAAGSGINPASFVWTSTGTPGASGNPAAITFPNPGFYTVKVDFADNAGNKASATTVITVTTSSGVIPPGTATKTPTKTATVPGGTITLSGPRTCVRVGKTFTATLAFKKSRKKGAKKVKIGLVVFSIDGKAVKTDKKAPFRQTLSVRSFAANSNHTLKARATIKVRHGASPKKSISVKFQVCSS